MNNESSSGVGARADALSSRAREEEIRATKEQVERWAQAFVPHVGAPKAAPQPPGDWRGSDGAMTPRTAQPAVTNNSTALGAEANSDGSSERLVVSVQAGDLGELSLVLDRSEQGVRVVIGVQNGAAAGLLVPEREALVRHLLGAGVTLQSVQIVNQSEVGTVLAPPRFIAKTKAFATPAEAEQTDGKARRRDTRKLNLIG